MTEITTGILTVGGTSTLTYTPVGEREVWATATGSAGTATTPRTLVLPGGIQPKLQAAADRYHWTKATLHRDAFGLALPGSNSFDAGCLAPNGKFYSCPRTATSIAVVDTTGGGDHYMLDFGDALDEPDPAVIDKWGYGGVLGSDGRLYFCPRDAHDVLILDPNTAPGEETIERKTFGLDLSDVHKWRGGVAALGGDRIYFIPRESTDILIIDVPSQTAVRHNLGASMPALSIEGQNKWLGGTLDPHSGKIYALPIAKNHVLVIDPSDTTAHPWGTAFLEDFGLDLVNGIDGSEQHKWTGCVLGPDGKIYGVPNQVTDVLVIDPTDTSVEFPHGTAVRTDFGTTLPATVNKWSGGCLGPDGKIYCVPFNVGEDYLLVIDPTAGTCERTTLEYGLLGENWVGATQGFDGRIYSFPRTTLDLLVITTQAAPLPEALLLSGYLNKF